MKNWWLIDWKNGDVFEENLGNISKEKALKIAKAKWDALSKYDKEERDEFYIVYTDVHDDAVDLDGADETIDIKGMERYWYAVQTDSSDDWDRGSFDKDEAIAMLKEQGEGLIAVIDTYDDFCVDEIRYEDI